MVYSEDEVRVLVEEYLELQWSPSWFVRLRLMDLTRALPWVSPKTRPSLVLLYSLHLPVSWVAEREGVHENTVYRRAESALSELTKKMNGGRYG